MATNLQQDTRFAHITGPNELLAALEDVARMGDVGARGAVYPGTKELAARAGMRGGGACWKDSWLQQATAAEPEPLTVESYRAVFGGTQEQAEAVLAVYEAMGIPLDRLKVAKGAGGASVLYQDAVEPAPIFYSKLRQVLDAKMPNKGATTGQVLAILTNPQNGVKAEEVQWSGLRQFIADKPTVTKAEAQAFLDANQIQVKEVVLGEWTPAAEAQQRVKDANEALKAYLLERKGFTAHGIGDYLLDAARADLSPSQIEIAQQDPEQWRLVSELRQAYVDRSWKGGEERPTKFGAYTLAGGENYRELLLTLPEKKVVLSRVATEGARYARSFFGGHFDEPNVLPP